jgi:hypothetical protein
VAALVARRHAQGARACRGGRRSAERRSRSVVLERSGRRRELALERRFEQDYLSEFPQLHGARVKTILMLMLVLASSPALAVTASVEKVLAYYHTDVFLEQAMGQMEGALERRRKEITVPSARGNEVLATARKIYKGANLFSVFKVAYAKAITLEQMTALAAWQVGIKGLLLKRGLDEYYGKGKKAPPPKTTPNRRNAINTYIAAQELVDLHTAFMLGADLGIWMALDAYQPRESRDSVKFMKEKIKARKIGYNEPARLKAFDNSVEILKGMKNEEIDEVAKFGSSANGQAASRAYRRALELTMERAAETLTAQLQKTIGG